MRIFASRESFERSNFATSHITSSSPCTTTTPGAPLVLLNRDEAGNSISQDV